MTDKKQKLYTLLAYWKAQREMAPDEKAIKWCDDMIRAINEMIRLVSYVEIDRGS